MSEFSNEDATDKSLIQENASNSESKVLENNDVYLNKNSNTLNNILKIKFTAKGNDYFKIWITNLALTIITLGIYYPWAKARQQRYFWAHTVVGDHALGFHGRAQSMFKGYAIAAFLSALYYGLSKISPEYGSAMLIILAIIYPVLFRASLRFLLLNTSWRGLRFKFKATVKQSYQYLSSSIVVSCLITLIPLVLVYVYGELFDTVNNDINWKSYTPALVSTLLLVIFGVPIAYFYIKKFQRDFYSFANIQTRLNANSWGFFKILIKTILFSIFISIIIGVIGAILGLFFGIFSSIFANPYLKSTSFDIFIYLLIFSVFFIYFLYFIVVNSYFNSRIFNFFWGNIVSSNLTMNADLKLKPLIFLNSKNWILILLSLGLYYPFAKVASTRMQLESLSIQTSLDFDQLVSDASIENENNLGQAMTDLFDFDFGF